VAPDSPSPPSGAERERAVPMRPELAHRLRRAMDALYWACAGIAGSALVIISLVVPYVLDSASSWPEPMAVLLSIVLTFFGAAACYRSGTHMRVSVLRDLLPVGPQRAVDLVAEGLMALVSVFMIVWGGRLVLAAWYQVIAEFPFLSVGVTYLPIPIGGAVILPRHRPLSPAGRRHPLRRLRRRSGQDGRRDARDLAVLRGDVSCPDAGDLRPDDFPMAAAPAVAVTWPTTKALTPLSLRIVFSHDQIHGDFVLRAA
jgi:TRAP-type C4-dicarboxylate transport system permease small subunit